MQTEWRSFQGGAWETEVNVRDFIQKNYHPYDGDDSFLEGPTQDTTDLWDQVLELSRQEREAGGRRLSVEQTRWLALSVVCKGGLFAVRLYLFP